MKIATAPVNWNNADVPDFREWFPYPQILDLMVAAGYKATEWGMNIPSHVSRMLTDLNERQLQLLGGFVALELRNEAKLASEIERAIEFGHFFKSLGGQLLIAADSGYRVPPCPKLGVERLRL
jgi:inosose dehydratase